MDALFPHLAKLQSFLAIAREGSFHAAARDLRLSQPSLTQSVRILESAIGSPLFIRSSRGVTLTRTGEAVLEFGNRLEGSLLSLRASLTTDHRNLAKHLRVGANESAAIYIWPSAIKLAKQEISQLELTLATGRSDEIMEALKQRELDVAFATEPKDEPGLALRVLYSDHFGLYATPRALNASLTHSKGTSRRLSSDVLDTLPLILFYSARVSQGVRLGTLIGESGIDKRKILRVESFEVAKEFCRQGLGIAILPSRVAARQVSEGTLVQVTLAELPMRDMGRHRFCFCYRQDHWEIESIRALEKIVRRVTRLDSESMS